MGVVGAGAESKGISAPYNVLGAVPLAEELRAIPLMDEILWHLSKPLETSNCALATQMAVGTQPFKASRG